MSVNFDLCVQNPLNFNTWDTKQLPEIYHEKPLKYYADMEYLLNQISCYAKKSYDHEPRQKVDIVDFIESECHEYSSNHFDVTFNTATVRFRIMPFC